MKPAEGAAAVSTRRQQRARAQLKREESLIRMHALCLLFGIPTKMADPAWFRRQQRKRIHGRT